MTDAARELTPARLQRSPSRELVERHSMRRGGRLHWTKSLSKEGWVTLRLTCFGGDGLQRGSAGLSIPQINGNGVHYAKREAQLAENVCSDLIYGVG